MFTPLFTLFFTPFFTLFWICFLLPLQLNALRPVRTLLLQNGAGHLPLRVKLKLEDRPSRVLEAGL